jgi:hypothetical protein
MGSARQLHLVVSPSCPLASYQKKEIKKRGSKRIRLPRATQSREAPPPPTRGCWQVKKGKCIQRRKKKKVDNPKKKKRESEGTGAHAQITTNPSFALSAFTLVISNI